MRNFALFILIFLLASFYGSSDKHIPKTETTLEIGSVTFDQVSDDSFGDKFGKLAGSLETAFILTALVLSVRLLCFLHIPFLRRLISLTPIRFQGNYLVYSLCK
ncbi:hypothetical protein CVD28_13760 [Bacillus sp. M6-12]|nr:hypothetical protein CVD28_13760 [Bacillus sp. M6-12]